MDLLVLGRMLLSSWGTLLSSSVIHYSVQAGPVLLLHAVSIMGTVVEPFNTRIKKHTDTSASCTHT